MGPTRGFTLVELSIVLVIIGLVIGGILLGRDLIAVAAVRAQISQVDAYRTSINSFRLKYRFFPGDLPPSHATRLGFFAETTLGGTTGHQDGDGRIVPRAESLGMWRHLTDAQLIDGNYGTAEAGNALDPTTGVNSNPESGAGVMRLLPPARIGRGIYLWAEWGNFWLLAVTDINTSGIVATNFTLTPSEAEQIDTKMDDGIPNSGRIRSTSVPGTCVIAGRYDVSSAGNVPSCALAIRFAGP